MDNYSVQKNKQFKTGFVALIGMPNVGKSSIINAMLEEKAVAVTHKPQTTRDAIRCIYTSEKEQIIFVDTPGVHSPEHSLGKYMLQKALDTLNQVDLICFVVDALSSKINPKEEMIIETLSSVKVPVVLVVNKIDKLKNIDLCARVSKLYSDRLYFKDIVPISALKNDNLDKLIEKINAYLPAQPCIYDKEMLMDTTERFLAAEIIREKILVYTEDEVPHSVAVLIEEFKNPVEYPELKVAKIRATIIVDRAGQKGIIIGKKGSKLKEIGSAARIDLVKKFGYPIYLELWVKVKPGWKKSVDELRRLGYSS